MDGGQLYEEFEKLLKADDFKTAAMQLLETANFGHGNIERNNERECNQEYYVHINFKTKTIYCSVIWHLAMMKEIVKFCEAQCFDYKSGFSCSEDESIQCSVD